MSPQQKSLETFMEVMHASNFFTSLAERELFLLLVAARVVQWVEEGAKK